MADWKSRIDPGMPCWDGYRRYFEALASRRFPGPDSLSDCLPPETVNHGGQPVRFVPASDWPGVEYERHIFETGQVPTRGHNWHDLFNALVWCRLPRLKAAMNRLHYEELDSETGNHRSRSRDALTLLDESGVIVHGSHAGALGALARHDWAAAFIEHRAAWARELQVLVCGHANLEKFLDPYKSQTAHALLVFTPGRVAVQELDRFLARSLVEDSWLKSPAGLSPLPLAGIPGWWPSDRQGPDFYDDAAVFRPPPPHRRPAPVHELSLA